VLLGGTIHGAIAIEEQFNVRVPMRDGVHLSANVFYAAGTGRHATILVRTPYGKGTGLSDYYRGWVERGYALVLQDTRGRHDSDGIFRAFQQEGPDGDDTLNWIARQPWSDGSVGMVGGSYLGIAQWEVAVRGNPHLKAIFPTVAGCDAYFDRFYSRGGAMKLAHRLSWMAENVRAPGLPEPELKSYIWHLPVRTADVAATGQVLEWYREVMEHPVYDNFWRSVSVREKLSRVRVPVFAVGGWYDNYAQSDLEAFGILRSLGRQAHVLIGPWGHNMSERVAGADFGPGASIPIRPYQYQWFDHWLKGKEMPALSPARIFVTGVNAWHDEDDWPPADARAMSFFLQTKGRLGRDPERKPRFDQFTYNPRNPAPTRGGALCCNAKLLPPGPLDQRSVESRPDVLVYTGGALKDDVEIAGTVLAQLFVSTSAPDTDFTAKLVDVWPDGTPREITSGILRLRYRNGLDHPVLARPGETYRITVDAGVAAHVFLRGHRIGVEVSSSNFPRFDRNLNTGRPVERESDMRIAQQTVYYGRVTPSAVVLPVVHQGRRPK
jgi:putative CocE/NonD family hydrolase